jgi:Tol biopolymer transport system component
MAWKPVVLHAVAAALASLPASAQRTVRVSTSTFGDPAAGSTAHPSISADGRYVVFSSQATNLVPGDGNRAGDVFRHDRFTSETVRVSVSSAGIEGDASSDVGYAPSISADGRFVVFISGATNLVPGDTNRKYDVFVRDLVLGQTVRASESAAGGQANESSFYASISADGRFVAFSSEADDLVPGDTNGVDDVFVRDLATGAIVRASVDAGGLEADGDSYEPVLSADGRYVAFSSEASNLAAGDANQVSDVFLKDTLTGATILVSANAGGSSGNGYSASPSLSADGRIVAFVSLASDLAAGDLNGFEDAFVRDVSRGVTRLASVSTRGQQADDDTYYGPSISADGRFVAFNSTAYSLVVPDAFGGHDVYLRDLVSGVTTRDSVNTAGVQGNGDSYAPSVSADGRFVAFKSAATNLVEDDGNGFSDVVVRDRGSAQAALFCGAETFGQDCPCSNAGDVARGCDNSDNTHGAWLADFGSASLSSDSLVIVATGATANSRSFLVQGTAGTAARPLGEGMSCLGPGARRLYVRNSTAGGGLPLPGTGDLSVSARSASLGDPIPAGTTRFYQLHYHDAAPFYCGLHRDGLWNVSSGIAITWKP